MSNVRSLLLAFVIFLFATPFITFYSLYIISERNAEAMAESECGASIGFAWMGGILISIYALAFGAWALVIKVLSAKINLTALWVQSIVIGVLAVIPMLFWWMRFLIPSLSN